MNMTKHENFSSADSNKQQKRRTAHPWHHDSVLKKEKNILKFSGNLTLIPGTVSFCRLLAITCLLMMMTGGDYIQASKEHNIGSFRCSKPPENPEKNNNMENKRRFTDEQIRSLECIFESESKLEPRKKMQLARDLGLQPRQVAIWFQNRRARWKSKHIEQEYRKLRDEYDNLSSLFESTKKEKESLQAEVQKLRVLVETCGDSSKGEKRVGMENSADEGASGSGQNCSAEAKPNFSNEGSGNPKNDDIRELGSTEKWHSVDASGLLDQSCSSSQWLDFWN